jgi:hypothetical protein
MAVVTLCYVAARVLLAAPRNIGLHPDTDSYRVPPGFFGQKSRPWVVPLLHWVATDRTVVVAQAALSGVTFVVLAVSIASMMTRQPIRVAVLASILAVGLSPRVTAWDTMMLSESIGLSLSALLIVCLIWLDHFSAWLVTVIFALWIFSRDGHVYLGVLVVLGVLWSCWSRRAWVLAVSLI